MRAAQARGADIGRHSALAVGEVLVDAAAYERVPDPPAPCLLSCNPSILEGAAGKTPNAKPGAEWALVCFGVRRLKLEIRTPNLDTDVGKSVGKFY
jgi:hypothetical protein